MNEKSIAYFIKALLSIVDWNMSLTKIRQMLSAMNFQKLLQAFTMRHLHFQSKT